MGCCIMKKIRIVTFQNACNQGAILQCFALLNAIKKIGYKDVEVLNYRNPNIENEYKVFSKPTGKYLVFKYIKSLIRGIVYYNNLNTRNKKFEKVINEKLVLTKPLTKKEILKNNYDSNFVFVAGSDQIWNTDLTNGFDDVYFLNFGENIRKISYAASIGKNALNEKYEQKISDALDEFQAISVREETAKNVLSKQTKKDITVVLDPTLLLNREDWDLHTVDINETKYILVYMANKDCVDIVNYVSQKENLKIICVDKNRKDMFKGNIKTDITVTPFEFISYIKNAEYVFTTSFHATIFSIIFNKKFWVVIPKKVGSRIIDLLKKIGLENRIVINFKEFLTKNYKENIDYIHVEKNIDKLRKHSTKWLGDSLKG